MFAIHSASHGDFDFSPYCVFSSRCFSPAHSRNPIRHFPTAQTVASARKGAKHCENIRFSFWGSGSIASNDDDGGVLTHSGRLRFSLSFFSCHRAKNSHFLCRCWRAASAHNTTTRVVRRKATASVSSSAFFVRFLSLFLRWASSSSSSLYHHHIMLLSLSVFCVYTHYTDSVHVLHYIQFFTLLLLPLDVEMEKSRNQSIFQFQSLYSLRFNPFQNIIILYLAALVYQKKISKSYRKNITQNFRHRTRIR